MASWLSRFLAQSVSWLACWQFSRLPPTTPGGFSQQVRGCWKREPSCDRGRLVDARSRTLRLSRLGVRCCRRLVSSTGWNLGSHCSSVIARRGLFLLPDASHPCAGWFRPCSDFVSDFGSPIRVHQSFLARSPSICLADAAGGFAFGFVTKPTRECYPECPCRFPSAVMVQPPWRRAAGRGGRHSGRCRRLPRCTSRSSCESGSDWSWRLASVLGGTLTLLVTPYGYRGFLSAVRHVAGDQPPPHRPGQIPRIADYPIFLALLLLGVLGLLGLCATDACRLETPCCYSASL